MIPTTLAELYELGNAIRHAHNPSAIIVTPAEMAALRRVSVPPAHDYRDLPPVLVGTPVIVDWGDHVMQPGEVRLSEHQKVEPQ